MFKYVLAAVAVIFSVSANAADISLEVRKNGEATYIYYSGKTTASDKYKIQRILEEAEEHVLPFGNAIVMNGPGGDAEAALELAHLIEENEWSTLANGPCASACSLMWMAGGIDNRYLLGPEANVQFHFAYTRDASALDRMKELTGWLGVQDYVASTSHYYTANLLRYEVVDPARFVWAISYYGSTETFYEVTEENLNEYTGGKIWIHEEMN